MPFGVGIWEVLILLLVALLIFGPKRLPEMGRSLGRGFREFKDSISGMEAPASSETSTTTQPAPPAALPPAHEEPYVAPPREDPVAAPVRDRDSVS